MASGLQASNSSGVHRGSRGWSSRSALVSPVTCDVASTRDVSTSFSISTYDRMSVSWWANFSTSASERSRRASLAICRTCSAVRDMRGEYRGCAAEQRPGICPILGAMRLRTLSGRKACDRVLRQGTVWKGRCFTVRLLPGEPKNLSAPARHPAVYLGTFASTALDKSAVRRNRMRRRCREAFRLSIATLPETAAIQLLVSPRSASLDTPFPRLQEEVLLFLNTRLPWPKNAPHHGSSSSR